MTDLQMYILVAIPLFGILANTALSIHLSGRIDTTNGGIDAMNVRIDARLEAINARIEARLEALNTSMNTRFDMVTGKLNDIDSRVAVLEDRRNNS